jgi:CDP-diglyceride synthetase
LARRHSAYVLVGFLTITVATVKIVLTMGVDVPLLLPLGMALTDIFGALIGVAILKDRLLDITVIVKKTAIYSALGAAVVVVFGLCEHILATYVAEFIGEESQLLHLISIAVVIALAMPLKHQLERLVEGAFGRRMVEV